MFEATLRRSDPEAPLRWIAAFSVVFLLGGVSAASIAAGSIVRYIWYFLLYLMWMLFGGQEPVLLSPPELIAVVELELVEEPPVEIEETDWDGAPVLEPEDLVAAGAPAAPERRVIPPASRLAISRISRDDIVKEAGIIALLGTYEGDGGSLSDVLSGGAVVGSDWADGTEIGSLIGARGVQIGSGGLGSRGTGGGGTAEGIGGLGMRGLAVRGTGGGGGVGYGRGSGGLGLAGFSLLDASGSGADVKARVSAVEREVRCKVAVRPEEEPALTVSGCPSRQHGLARRAVERAGKAGTRGDVRVLLVP